VKLAPSSSLSRPRVVQLAVLLVVLAVVMYWRFGDTAVAPVAASNPKTAPIAPAPATQAAGGKAQGNAMPSPLKFAALEPVPAETPASRNPFKFYTPPPPPPPPPPPQKSPAQLAEQEAARQKSLVPPGPPPPPPITLRYIGKFQQGGKTVAILTDGKAAFSVFEGGVIDGRFRVVKIGLESLQIEYVNGKGLTTLPFKG
jgi:hypothetical protein